MTSLVIKLALRILAVWVAAYIVPGIHYSGWVALVIFAVVLAVLNTILKPILKIITLPINIITIGLFGIVINAAMVLLAARLVEGFNVDGFLPALLFGLVLAVVDFVLRIKD